MDQDLHEVVERQELLDGTGVLHQAVPVRAPILELRAWKDDFVQSTESSVGKLKLEDLTRDVVDQWIRGRQVNPRTGESNQIRDGLAGSDCGVCGRQARDGGDRVLEGSVLELGELSSQQCEHSTVEQRGGDWSGKHVVLRGLSATACYTKVSTETHTTVVGFAPCLG